MEDTLLFLIVFSATFYFGIGMGIWLVINDIEVNPKFLHLEIPYFLVLWPYELYRFTKEANDSEV